MPITPHAHRDLSGLPVTALVSPVADAPTRVYAEASPALYQLGTVTAGPDGYEARCCVRGCEWSAGGAGATAAVAATMLAAHHGVETHAAAACGLEWAARAGL